MGELPRGGRLDAQADDNIEPSARQDDGGTRLAAAARRERAVSCPIPTLTVAPPLTRLSEDEQLFADSVYEFAHREIRPLVREMDEQAAIARPLLPKLFDLGIMGIEIPEQYGGAGATLFHSVLAVEALSRVDPAVGVLVDVQNTLVVNAVVRWGERRPQAALPHPAGRRRHRRVLPVGGRLGSDAFALTTRAVDDGDAYALTGRKLWITNANEADVFIVFATVNPDAGYKGITAFLVERGTPGFTVGKKEDKLGIRASSTCELLFDDCRVPKANVLGEVGKGYKVAIETLNEGRIGIGAQMLGLAQGAFDHTVAYVKEREQFGKAIADFQGVQFQLARMACDVEVARAARLQRRAAARRRPAVPAGGGDLQAGHLGGGRAGRLAGRQPVRRRRAS